MTNKTILTPEQVDTLLEGVLRASGSRLGNYTFQKTLDELRASIRAIEQAVLQSPEIQELRKDAARYRVIRNASPARPMTPRFSMVSLWWAAWATRMTLTRKLMHTWSSGHVQS